MSPKTTHLPSNQGEVASPPICLGPLQLPLVPQCCWPEMLLAGNSELGRGVRRRSMDWLHAQQARLYVRGALPKMLQRCNGDVATMAGVVRAITWVEGSPQAGVEPCSDELKHQAFSGRRGPSSGDKGRKPHGCPSTTRDAAKMTTRRRSLHAAAMESMTLRIWGIEKGLHGQRREGVEESAMAEDRGAPWPDYLWQDKTTTTRQNYL